MTLTERLAMQARNLTALFNRAIGKYPEKGDLVFGALSTEYPENWVPIEVDESYTISGGVEIHGHDSGNIPMQLNPGDWVDMDIARSLWGKVVPFTIESSRGKELFVVENSNTMVYVPKCKIMINTGLPDGSVMKAITSNSGNLRYTKCPVDAEGVDECEYPRCLSKMVTTPQPSIKAAKAAYRNSVCVCLTKEIQGASMLFLTNGANHLNLVPIEQAIDTAWSSDYLKDFQETLERLEIVEPVNLAERIAVLTGEEILRISDAEEQYKFPVESEVPVIIDELPDNISFKEKKPKARKSKKKDEVDLSDLDPEIASDDELEVTEPEE